MNYIEKVDNGEVSSTANKGGQYSKGSATRKSGISRAGDVAYDKKGVHLYNRLKKLLEELKSHSEYDDVVAESIQLWKANQEASDKSKKCRRTNFVTDETAAPVFDLLGIGLGLGDIDVTGAV